MSMHAGNVLIVDPGLPLGTLLLDAIHTHCPGLNATVCTDVHPEALTGVQLAICASGSTPGTYLRDLERILTISTEVPVLMLVSPDKPWLADEALAAGATDVLLRAPGYIEQIPVAVRKNLSAALARSNQSARVSALNQTLSEIREENRTLETLVDRLEAMASTDPLTGLGNRRSIESRLGEQFSSSVRHNFDLSVLMIDLDGLKLVNDTLGHAAGDELIQAAARAIRQTCRRSDIAARTGGDEFTIVLPHTRSDKAQLVAERIISSFNAHASDIRSRLWAERQRCGIVHIIHRGRRTPEGTIPGMSIGVCARQLVGAADGDALVAFADLALYAVKRSNPGSAAVFDHTAHARPAAGQAA